MTQQLTPSHPRSAEPDEEPKSRFPSVGLAFLVVSVIGSVLLFWRPWTPCSDAAGCAIAPGSITGWLLTGSLVMVIIALSGLAIGLIRRLDQRRPVPQETGQ